MVKEFVYRGKTVEELKKLSIKEYAQLLPSRQRRSLLRDFTDSQKKFLEKLSKKDNLKTHCRNLIVLPQMLGKTISVYSGKEWVRVQVEPEMLGWRLGDFALTRKRVTHSSPGIGATKSSSSLSVK